MTNPNHSHITVIADRSGSMGGIRDEAQNAINQFLDDQRNVDGTATLLLADFDGNEPFRVIHDGDLDDADPYTLEPRGMTPLLDAIGRGITMTGERLAALAEDDRPGHVFCVICTDGAENASREFGLEVVTKMISEHEQTWSWTFVFLATGMDAVAMAGQFQGTNMAASNVVRSKSTGAAYGAATSFVSTAVAQTRGGHAVRNYGADVDDDGNVTADPT